MAQQQVRVRVAPSPTGDPHVGTAYQALFNSTFAKSRGGQFILRIEDTDQVRSTPQSERAILEALHWLGIQWDEGPDVGGPHAPYRQSERTEIYRWHAQQLLDQGHAFRCFCTKEQIAARRAAELAQKLNPGRDPDCRAIPRAESDRRAAAGEPFTIRMRVPEEGICVIQDLLHGEIRKEWATVDEQILLKSDGFPTYHLANVVDDHLMEISHVIRGEEWISSVPKHIKLYEYFGWEPPVWCHLPLLRNNDETKSKLSKRKNPTSINYYRRAGYLPEALLNFLGMMGWAMPDGREKFTVAEMVENFQLEDVSLGGPVFDIQKLRWLNGRYIREDYDTPRLRQALVSWALGPETLDRIIPLAQPRLETLADWGYLTAFFFADQVPIDPKELQFKGKAPDEVTGILQLVLWRLEGVRDWRSELLDGLFREMAEQFGIKLRDFTRPFYVAIAGTAASTPLFQSMEILGSDMSRMRLRRALETLGGVSGKRQKVLEKEFENLFGPKDA